MPLPALSQAVGRFVRSVSDRFSSGPETLDLGTKAVGDISFDAVNVGWYARNGYPKLYSLLSGGSPSWSGESVSLESALNHSVVFAATRMISESAAFLPLSMMQKRGNVTREVPDHPMNSGLDDAPNEEMTAMSFRSTLTAHCLLRGSAYAQIIRRSGTGTAMEMYPLQPEQVTPDRDGSNRLVYVVKTGPDAEKTYTVRKDKPHDIFHMANFGPDGINGYSVIHLARQSIGTAIATERNVGRFYANGGRLPYVLEMQQRFKSDEDFQAFRQKWESVYSEPHKAPILENDIKYHQIGLSAADSQLLETRMFNIPEICRWFNISPHLVADLSRATFSNIEQLSLEFGKFTLTDWLIRWEKSLRLHVLTPEERAQKYYWKHNVDALQRGDFASRVAGYATMLQNGVYSINEVRDLEDINPIDVGDDHHIQLNMQTLGGESQLPSEMQQQAAEDTSPKVIRLGKPAAS